MAVMCDNAGVIFATPVCMHINVHVAVTHDNVFLHFKTCGCRRLPLPVPWPALAQAPAAAQARQAPLHGKHLRVLLVGCVALVLLQATWWQVQVALLMLPRSQSTSRYGAAAALCGRDGGGGDTTAAQQHSSAAAQHHSTTAPQQHSSAAAQHHSSAAAAKSRSNSSSAERHAHLHRLQNACTAPLMSFHLPLNVNCPVILHSLTVYTPPLGARLPGLP